MMKKYIDADKIRDYLLNAALTDDEKLMLLRRLEAIPGEDVAEVRQGEWDLNYPTDNIVYCNRCMMPSDIPARYCPSCGALMEATP